VCVVQRDFKIFPFSSEILTSGLPLQKLPLATPNPNVKCNNVTIPGIVKSTPIQVCAETKFSTSSNNAPISGNYNIWI
jgi:hypothetical protein